MRVVAPEFAELRDHRPGVLCDLLAKSYAELLTADEERWGHYRQDWREFDSEAFANPDTIGRCVFVTALNGEPVGFASFDPRQAPEIGIVGHNCILPESRRRGYGRLQVEELLRRFRDRGIKRALVQTGDHPFFIPAQRQYLACGFVEIRRLPGSECGLIEYAREIAKLESLKG